MSSSQNGTVWADGRLRGWPDVAVPLMSDAVVRSAAAFDGLRAHRTSDGRIALIAGQAHARRLVYSARALRLPLAYGVEEILAGCADVAAAELAATGGTIAYVRPMVLGATLTPNAGSASLVITAFAQPDRPPEPQRLQIAALRRPIDDSLPPQIKAVANYQVSRLIRLTARAAGYDDALLLNAQGRLAEAAGAAVLVERDGQLFTPPAWEGCLPSITVDLIARFAEALGIVFVREPVPLSAIWMADGLALAGTLADLVEVRTVDDLELPAGPALSVLRTAYHAALDPADFASPYVDLLDLYSVAPGQ